MVPSPRLHIVLVQGFAGFDALGQLEYYAGVTPLFRSWQKDRGHLHAVLHYFDNFPTAAVSTRATRLRHYLTKRIARGEFSSNDSIALIGHSTGGLNIRRLIWDLAEDVAVSPTKTFGVDGGEGAAFKVQAKKLLQMIGRIVFLSVPQWGTNIADWVRAHAPERTVVVTELRALVASSQMPLLDKLQGWASGVAASMTNLDLFYALEDALCEAEVGRSKDSMGTAMAQEAASELELWLRHMATDFAAIDDLTARPPTGRPVSPAHFSSKMRDQEKRYWRKHRIRTHSYATHARFASTMAEWFRRGNFQNRRRIPSSRAVIR